MEKFKFRVLFPKNTDQPSHINFINALKDKEFYKVLKLEDTIAKTARRLRTMCKILSEKSITNPTLFWLEYGLEAQLAFIKNKDGKEYFMQIFGLLMYAKFAFDNNNSNKYRLGQQLIYITIGKLSTIINLEEYSDKKKYIMKVNGKVLKEEQIPRQIELYLANKLDVNSIIFDIKR